MDPKIWTAVIYNTILHNMLWRGCPAGEKEIDGAYPAYSTTHSPTVMVSRAIQFIVNS